MVWELKDDSQPLYRLPPRYFHRDICLENHVLNIPFMKSFANLLTVKYSGWNTCVMFGGIFVDEMLLSSARPETCELFVLERRHI